MSLTKEYLFSLRCEHSLRKRISSCFLISENGCHEYMGTKDKFGYGKISTGERRYAAHRVVYAVLVGDIPEGSVVMHKCDNPSCINPDHLELGTQMDNVVDCASKGRLKARNMKVPKIAVSNSNENHAIIFSSTGSAVEMGFHRSRVARSANSGESYRGFTWHLAE